MIDLYTLHQAHLQALGRLRRRPATLKSYRTYVGAFLRFLEERGVEPHLTALTPELVGEAQDWLRAHSTGTRDGATAEYVLVARLKSFSRWLWRRQLSRHDPLDRLTRPHLDKIHRQPYSQAEVRRLLWAAAQGPSPEMERALLLLMLDTGCRIGELCATSTSDLDLEAGAVVFRRTKNRRPRRVIVRVNTLADGGPCIVALRAWLEMRAPQPGVEAVFLDRYGFALSERQGRAIWRQLGQLAAVGNPIPHRGRHTHATELLAELPGAELHLRHRLGHLSEDVLRDYVSISDPMAQQVANAASISAKWNL